MKDEFLELLVKAIDDALNHAHYSLLHPDIEKPIEHNEWKHQWLLKNLPLYKQNCIKHDVSGSDPLYQLAKKIGFENVSEDDLQKVIDKTKGLRSASGAVAKTVSEGKYDTWKKGDELYGG